jgi:hypothetical protein
MIKFKTVVVLVAGVLAWQPTMQAEVKVLVESNATEAATSGFRFVKVPAPSRNDAATGATFAVVDGRLDQNGGGLDTLHDGKVPSEGDQPRANAFFSAGTEGGRISVDLGKVIEIKQVNSYSWHPAERGPQVYALYASDGQGAGFNGAPKRDTDPTTCGWKLIAKVDTRPHAAEMGGQYGVSIADPAGALGRFRHLLFDVSRTESTDSFGHTFYSEIDVVDAAGPAPEPVEAPAAKVVVKDVVTIADGKYQVVVDTSETPELTDWARKEVEPMMKEWYPKLVAMLPSEGYVAPAKFTLVFDPKMQGVAATGGTGIRCSGTWARQNMKGEAVGALFHEMVHVVQQYGRAPRGGTRPAVWLTEGITDYLRWYVYEPKSGGAEMSRRGFPNARYNASYRVTANFLNYTSQKYDTNLVFKLNTAIREGKFSEDIWKNLTGHTAQELNTEWRTALAAKLGIEIKPEAAANVLTDVEKAAGWELLFNGKDLSGWHNFKKTDVRPGWQIKDGTLACVDPHDAGDLVTEGQYEWFELQLDYNISEGGNSGIIFHVSDEGGAVWASGPEVQLEDNAKASDPQRCGWLYALYQPPLDPKTGKILDATKPAGEWNHVRLLISKDKCEHEINGVKYFEYVLDSDDFKARVAKSKFNSMPLFAKVHKGHLALQGDHGQVTFRNIKVRPVK